jgi:AraC-like DNA-binding protein
LDHKLRSLYQPIQLTIRQSATDEVTYLEWLPDPRLQAFIYCYWELKTLQPLATDFSYRVVVDGCIDILLELDRPTENFVTGLSTSYVEFPLGQTFYYIGIRFLPTAFPQLFQIDASSLTNRFEDLANVLPGLSRFLGQQLDKRQSIEVIKESLNHYLLQWISKQAPQVDDRVLNALAIILKDKGMVDIGSLNTGLSPRQLRRRFHYYLGGSAKTFSKVVRFQQLLQAKPSKESLKHNKIFYDVGYYDQAHFIKEFKHFYGLTPSKALK